ncbi:uncharacterized protein BKA78DRAFT_319824 [Phyllosticta capitalensis]|uniref:uncharacterized protein n=1 Tax=Phyllosticta capitalensis TaxID=121624 RepID=UPI00312F64BD
MQPPFIQSIALVHHHHRTVHTQASMHACMHVSSFPARLLAAHQHTRFLQLGRPTCPVYLFPCLHHLPPSRLPAFSCLALPCLAMHPVSAPLPACLRRKRERRQRTSDDAASRTSTRPMKRKAELRRREVLVTRTTVVAPVAADAVDDVASRGPARHTDGWRHFSSFCPIRRMDGGWKSEEETRSDT